jgi:hypothetical protein
MALTAYVYIKYYIAAKSAMRNMLLGFHYTLVLFPTTA